MAKLTSKEIIAALKDMTLLEVNSLIEAIEKEFNITATMPVATPSTDAPAAAQTTPSEVSVFIKEIGPNKILVIKAIREITGLGLMEAKKLIDGAIPCSVKEKIKLEEAEKIKQQLEAAKAVVEIK